MKSNKVMVTALVLMGVLSLASPDYLKAQAKGRTDLTGRQNVSSEEIIQGLKPAPTYRGITPVISAAPAAALPAVALSVLFATASDRISPEAAKNLNSLGEALQSPDLATYRIRIEGHTDAVGSDAYNLQLSQKRAQSVKRYLTSRLGVDPSRLVTVGRGEQEPVDDNSTPEGRQRNRRVEFVNIGTK